MLLNESNVRQLIRAILINEGQKTKDFETLIGMDNADGTWDGDTDTKWKEWLSSNEEKVKAKFGDKVKVTGDDSIASNWKVHKPSGYTGDVKGIIQFVNDVKGEGSSDSNDNKEGDSGDGGTSDENKVKAIDGANWLKIGDISKWTGWTMKKGYNKVWTKPNKDRPGETTAIGSYRRLIANNQDEEGGTKGTTSFFIHVDRTGVKDVVVKAGKGLKPEDLEHRPNNRISLPKDLQQKIYDITIKAGIKY